jgi:hypothetical protein
MKLALIPPRAHLMDTPNTGYHLLLPQHADDLMYHGHYMHRRAFGDFLILDNGIAEGVEVSPEELIRIACKYMVNEVVIPDTIGDGKTTIEQARNFKLHADRATAFHYIGVAQGRTYDELQACAGTLAGMYYVHTIAIPRHVETTIGSGTRLRLAMELTQAYDIPIHLLGTNPGAMHELKQYGEIYHMLGIRGIDTASPYYYTMKEECLINMKDVRREPDYYDAVARNKPLLDINLAIMKEWVYGH